jgi:hypothetical protein
MRIVFILLPLCIFFLTGCYHDKEKDLAPCPADATHVHYTPDITALFTAYGCYGCHLGPAPEGGISLDGYTAVKSLVDNGKLVGAITHAAGFAPMPHSAPKMDDCDINRIKAWVAAGAPDH